MFWILIKTRKLEINILDLGAIIIAAKFSRGLRDGPTYPIGRYDGGIGPCALARVARPTAAAGSGLAAGMRRPARGAHAVCRGVRCYPGCLGAACQPARARPREADIKTLLKLDNFKLSCTYRALPVDAIVCGDAGTRLQRGLMENFWRYATKFTHGTRAASERVHMCVGRERMDHVTISAAFDIL